MKMLTTLRYSYRKFGKLTLDPFEKSDPRNNKKSIEDASEEIYQWAKDHGARYFSFLSFPHTEDMTEKQDSFLSLSLNRERFIKHIAHEKLTKSDLIKGEGDGSSFPNGGLRHTSAARGYFVWDWKSPVFIRRNGVLYIPALLLNHNGEALDQKTLYRKAQNYVGKATKNVLKRLGHDARSVFIGLGLEQEFFIIPKKQFHQRLDLQQTGRALLGRMPPHNQQFSDHYYGRLQPIVQKILQQAEDELLEIGVPVKTRHKEVALNQYELCSVFQDASRTIDQNIIKMKILEQSCDRHGFVPLWHEKPFNAINGSGKHMNWSLQFYNNDNKKRNLFVPENYDDDTFLMITLATLKALLNHQKLYMASVSVPGNELRLGGHEAPPRIISAFVGSFVNSMIQKLPQHHRENLRQKVDHLLTDVEQENTDRNRTSPYGFSSNRFEFRAAGSTQNCYFPMTVILTTIGHEMNDISRRLDSGESVKQVIAKLVEETAPIRFEGDGYTPQWIDEARKRGLYINERFTENLENLEPAGKILVQTGIYSKSELSAKSNIVKQKYINTVLLEAETILIILHKKIIPRCYSFLDQLSELKIKSIKQRRQNFEKKLEELFVHISLLEQKIKSKSNISLAEAEKARGLINKIGDLTNNVTDDLPEDKDWPELYDILGKF